MKLNLPEFDFRIKEENGKTLIFDVFRKKYVVLTPEEWVRQNTLLYLVQYKNYPKNLIVVEREININGLKRRYDALVFNKQSEVELLIEFKAPNVEITEAVFTQISAYNFKIKAPKLLVSNGLQHFFALIDFENQSFSFLKEIPAFEL